MAQIGTLWASHLNWEPPTTMNHSKNADFKGYARKMHCPTAKNIVPAPCQRFQVTGRQDFQGLSVGFKSLYLELTVSLKPSNPRKSLVSSLHQASSFPCAGGIQNVLAGRLAVDQRHEPRGAADYGCKESL